MIGRSNGRVVDLLGLAEPTKRHLEGAVDADLDALADPAWVGGFVEALGRVSVPAEEERAEAVAAKPGMLALDQRHDLAADDALVRGQAPSAVS